MTHIQNAPTSNSFCFIFRDRRRNELIKTFSFSDFPSALTKSIENSKMIEYPIYHLFIENIFSDEFYEQLKEKCDNPEKIDTRFQDNKNFTNSRFSITNSEDPILKKVEDIFENKEIKLSLSSKFFEFPDAEIKIIVSFFWKCILN